MVISGFMNQPVGGLQNFGRKRTFGTSVEGTFSPIPNPSVYRIERSTFTRLSFIVVKFFYLVIHAAFIRMVWNCSCCGYLKDCWSCGSKKIFPRAIALNSVASSQSNVITCRQDNTVINFFPSFLATTNSAPTSPSCMSCILSTGVKNLLFNWVHACLK